MRTRFRDRRAIREAFQLLSGEKPLFEAYAGDGQGNVKVPDGLPDQVFVRSVRGGAPVVVYNWQASVREGDRVLIGEDGYNKGLRQILRIKRYPGVDYTGSAEIPEHAGNHYLNGSDPVWIDTRQVTNLLAVPSGMMVVIYPGFVIIDNQIVWVPRTELDHSSYVPGSGAKWLLIKTADGTLEIQEGDALDSFADLQNTNLPEIEAGHVALWAVKMYYGQTKISNATTAPDLVDLRFAPRSGGGGGGDVSKSGTTTDGHMAVWDGNDTNTIKDGGAVPSGGDVSKSGTTTDGHIAVWDGADTSTIKDGGPVPSGSNLFSVQNGKSSPDTPDDEFAAGSLDGKWTVVAGSESAVNLLQSGDCTRYDLSTRVGYLLMQAKNGSVALRQDYTLPDGYSIVMAFSPAVTSDGETGIASNELDFSLVLNDNDADPNTGRRLRMRFDTQLGGWHTLCHWNNGSTDTYKSDTANANDTHPTDLASTMYYRIARVGTVYYAFYSRDRGETWNPFGFVDVGGTLNNVWIALLTTTSVGNPPPIIAVDWIRQGGNGFDPW